MADYGYGVKQNGANSLRLLDFGLGYCRRFIEKVIFRHF